MNNQIYEEIINALLGDELKFSNGKIIINGQELSILEVSKTEVMTTTFDRVFEMIKIKERNERKGFSSININIAGFDDLPEPIFEIECVRKFYRKLYRKMPYFLFYISPMGDIPIYILACLSDIEVKARHGRFISPLDLIHEQCDISDIGSTAIEIKLAGEIGYGMIAAIKAHAEEVGFTDEHEELPVLYELIESLIKAEERKIYQRGDKL